MQRNVFNISEIEGQIKTSLKSLLSGVDKDIRTPIEKWAKTTFRNYVLREYPISELIVHEDTRKVITGLCAILPDIAKLAVMNDYRASCKKAAEVLDKISNTKLARKKPTKKTLGTAAEKPKSENESGQEFSAIDSWAEVVKIASGGRYSRLYGNRNNLLEDATEYLESVSRLISVFAEKLTSDTLLSSFNIPDEYPTWIKPDVVYSILSLTSASGKSLHDELSDLIDVLASEWFYELRSSLAKMSVPDIVEKHEAWVAYETEQREYKEDVASLKEVFRFEDGAIVFELTSRQNLQREGKLMHNCVGSSGYLRKIEKGTHRIFSLRPAGGKPVMTIEVDVERHMVIQCRAQLNRTPLYSELQYLDPFFKSISAIPNVAFTMEIEKKKKRGGPVRREEDEEDDDWDDGDDEAEDDDDEAEDDDEEEEEEYNDDDEEGR